MLDDKLPWILFDAMQVGGRMGWNLNKIVWQLRNVYNNSRTVHVAT